MNFVAASYQPEYYGLETRGTSHHFLFVNEITRDILVGDLIPEVANSLHGMILNHGGNSIAACPPPGV